MSASSVAEVLELYGAGGADPYDEEVTQLAHALQTAARASAAGAIDALVAAALLHDVGHLLHLRDAGHGGGSKPSAHDLRHEEDGAAWLRPLFPVAVVTPIALHVQAKRYLCAVDPTYRDRLSAGSIRSLELQGAAMTPTESAAFEATHGFRDAVRLREWDDAGKVDGLAVVPIEHYRDLLEHLANEP